MVIYLHGILDTPLPLYLHFQYCLSTKLGDFLTPLSPLGADVVLNGWPPNYVMIWPRIWYHTNTSRYRKPLHQQHILKPRINCPRDRSLSHPAMPKSGFFRPLASRFFPDWRIQVWSRLSRLSRWPNQIPCPEHNYLSGVFDRVGADEEVGERPRRPMSSWKRCQQERPLRIHYSCQKQEGWNQISGITMDWEVGVHILILIPSTMPAFKTYL